MKCRDLQFILPLYSDNALSDDEQNLAERHLDICPVCRQKIADIQEIRNTMRQVRRPAMDDVALLAIRRAVWTRAETLAGKQMFQNVEDRRRWVDVWLMPFAVGSLSTLLLGFTLLWVIVTNEIKPQNAAGVAPSVSNTTILYPYSPSPSVPVEADLNPLEYASSRSGWGQESPSINPHGPLVALTENLLSEVKDNDEITVVADVYGNGSASITEVVEPSSDGRVVNQLQRALEANPSATAFVPASYDQRAEPVRVVLKIQSVSIDTKLR